MTHDTTDDGWYWDLEREQAVPASARGHADHMLGPYPTKGEAENWKATSEARNDAWDDADAEWNSWDDDDDDAATGTASN